MAKNLTLLLLVAAVALHACGEGEETCTCTCTCGRGEKSKLEGTSSVDDCANSCDTVCGNDSFNSSYDCKTQGVTSPTARDR